eukprot:TRINITY_DN8351_c0_g1_i1.p1 TRINITY_DN8351_c0_g1~~TRINITY_DN8351_c0_g1_i1.p1  ORF type:complete len:189 (+),score=32.30 TRINITY_DN8351_c0_g1_i1:101-667(+)
MPTRHVRAALRHSGRALSEQVRLLTETKGVQASKTRVDDKSVLHCFLVGLSSLTYLLPSFVYWRCGDSIGAVLFVAVATCSAGADGEWAGPFLSHYTAKIADRWTASLGMLYVLAALAGNFAGNPMIVPCGVLLALGSISCLVVARGCSKSSEWALWQSLWHITGATATAATTVINHETGGQLPYQWL